MVFNCDDPFLFHPKSGKMGVLTKILFLLAVGYQSGCNSDCESIRGIELHQRVASLSCADHSYGTPERARRCKQVQYALLGASDAVNMDTVNLPEPINNWTSLMMASYAGHDSLVRKLLDAGVDANMKDKCGWTALMFAVISAASSTCVIQLLLEHNADINLVKYHDHSALFMATANKKTKIVELLLENNANFRQRDIWGQSPITAGVYCYETERCIPEVIKVYLQFCHIRTDYAIINQALWTAVDHCCPTIISDLLNSGAHIHEMKKLLSRAENKTKLDHSSCRHCNCRNCDCVAVHAELKLYSINDEVTKSHCLTAEDIKLKKTNSRCASIHSLPLSMLQKGLHT